MNDPAQTGARAAAGRLVAEYGRQLPADVERALHLRDAPQRPDQYFDPASLGGLIVSIATLAWTVYTDLKPQTPAPAIDVIARAVRVRLDHNSKLNPDQQEHIIDVTVEETVRAGIDAS